MQRKKEGNRNFGGWREDPEGDMIVVLRLREFERRDGRLRISDAEDAHMVIYSHAMFGGVW